MQFFKNWGKIEEGNIRFLSQTNSILHFGLRITAQKFHQNRIKIATVGVFTNRLTEWQTDASDFNIICPMLCYSNGTDKNYRITLTWGQSNRRHAHECGQRYCHISVIYDLPHCCWWQLKLSLASVRMRWSNGRTNYCDKLTADDVRGAESSASDVTWQRKQYS